MQYGLCHLSIIPMRAEPTDSSEQTSQLLYGEFFKVLKRNNNWSLIRASLDNYEGWINNKQYQLIKEEQFETLEKTPKIFAADLVDFVLKDNQILFSIPIGSLVSTSPSLEHIYEGKTSRGSSDKGAIIQFALLFLNAPYQWGGKSPFGIDCSGFVQSVYRLYGKFLPRDAHQQAEMGDSLGFIEESEPGDLVFFDNNEGRIVHVGILMENYHIIHAFGHVRIDRLDQTGIYNADQNTHTHKLRVIKKLV
jgi:cell wall-associated NlpC family hydrolase